MFLLLTLENQTLKFHYKHVQLLFPFQAVWNDGQMEACKDKRESINSTE